MMDKIIKYTKGMIVCILFTLVIVLMSPVLVIVSLLNFMTDGEYEAQLYKLWNSVTKGK